MYKKDRYVTFRKKGGDMKQIFTVIDEAVIDIIKHDIQSQIKSLSVDVQNEILGYFNERVNDFGFEREQPYMFSILNKERDLLHKPGPPQNYNNHVYFYFDDLTDRGLEEVIITSKYKSNKQSSSKVYQYYLIHGQLFQKYMLLKIQTNSYFHIVEQAFNLKSLAIFLLRL